jgi:nucleotide-binding universal stress UspA family protein
VKVTCFVEPTKPSTTLLVHLADAQLLIVGDRGRNLLADLFLGSTSLNMLHHSAIPVVLCRADDQRQRPDGDPLDSVDDEPLPS